MANIEENKLDLEKKIQRLNGEIRALKHMSYSDSNSYFQVDTSTDEGKLIANLRLIHNSPYYPGRSFGQKGQNIKLAINRFEGFLIGFLNYKRVGNEFFIDVCE